MKNQKGFSLIELLVSSMVLTILIAACVHLSTSMSRATREVSLWKAEDRDLGNIVENVIKQFNYQQISFQALAVESSDSKLDHLPLAWNESALVPEAQCPRCPGRLGLSARPHPTFPGVFVVRVKLTNPELFQGEREYRFLSVYK